MTSPAPYVPGGDHNSVADAGVRQQGRTYRHPWMEPVDWTLSLDDCATEAGRDPVLHHDLPWPYDAFVVLVSDHVGGDARHAARAVGDEHVRTSGVRQ